MQEIAILGHVTSSGRATKGTRTIVLNLPSHAKIFSESMARLNEWKLQRVDDLISPVPIDLGMGSIGRNLNVSSKLMLYGYGYYGDKYKNLIGTRRI